MYTERLVASPRRGAYGDRVACDPRRFSRSCARGGRAEGEALRPLDLSTHPGSRSRGLVTETQIEAGRHDDRGWMFDWLAWSRAQTTAWRGIVTIRALTWLRDNGLLLQRR